jgi:hypothetical protein
VGGINLRPLEGRDCSVVWEICCSLLKLLCAYGSQPCQEIIRTCSNIAVTGLTYALSHASPEVICADNMGWTQVAVIDNMCGT